MTTTTIPNQDSELEPGSSTPTTLDESGQSAGAGGKGKDARPPWIWWEKTVEYCYALTHLHNYKLICPLDGNFERAGDVIMRKAASWCLIEFKRYEPTKEEKRTKAVIKVESKKFKGAKEAQDRLQVHVDTNTPKFHHIVHGVATQEGFGLGAHDYWNCTDSREAALLLTPDFTCEETPFYEYLTLFMRAKGGNSTDGGGGGTPPGDDPLSGPLGPPGSGGPLSSKKEDDLDFTNVLALTEEGGILCCPLREFHALLLPRMPPPPAPDFGDGGMRVKPNGPPGKGNGGLGMQLPELVIDRRVPISAPSWSEIGYPVNVPEMS
jgi:hypothetical protein